MRARWLKPEFFNDKKIGTLGPVAALVYEALWCMADDGGTSLCNAETVKGQMFMYWPAVGLPEIAEALRQLSGANRIACYSVGDDEFARIIRWKKHQPVHNPSKFRHPVPGQGVTANTAAVLQQDSSSPHHLDTSTPRLLDTQTPQVVEEVAMSNLLITRLNQGQLDNPAIGEAMNPVPHGHASSVAAAFLIEQAGVPQDFAAEFVYKAAKSYKPNDRNRQIKSLGYLTEGTISAWEKSEAKRAAIGTARPTETAASKPTQRSTGGKILAATSLIQKVRKQRNPQFPNSLNANWSESLPANEREIVKAFGIQRILNDTNEGTLVSQLAKALEEAA